MSIDTNISYNFNLFRRTRSGSRRWIENARECNGIAIIDRKIGFGPSHWEVSLLNSTANLLVSRIII